MKLAGDVSVGRRLSPGARNFLLGEIPPRALIYDIATMDTISVVGAYPGAERGRRSTTPLVPFHSPCPSAPFPDAYFSAAPLENVARLQVFSDSNDTRLCKGILLEYRNGAQRALGQCRHQVDPAESCTEPAYICVLHFTYSPPPSSAPELRAARVKSSQRSGHDHGSEQGWVCFTMEGTLKFWVSTEESDLSVAIDE